MYNAHIKRQNIQTFYRYKKQYRATAHQSHIMLLISYWLMCVCNLFIYHMNVSLLCKVCDKHIYIRTNEFVQFSISKFSVEKQLSGRSKTTETDSLNRFCFFFVYYLQRIYTCAENDSNK